MLLNDALSSGNQKYLLQILGIMAKRKGITEIAGETSTNRAHLDINAHELKAENTKILV